MPNTQKYENKGVHVGDMYLSTFLYQFKVTCDTNKIYLQHTLKN